MPHRNPSTQACGDFGFAGAAAGGRERICGPSCHGIRTRNHAPAAPRARGWTPPLAWDSTRGRWRPPTAPLRCRATSPPRPSPPAHACHARPAPPAVLCLALTAPAGLARRPPAATRWSGDGAVQRHGLQTAKIPILDGFTGKAYEGANATVVQFAQPFNKAAARLPKKLVLDEVKHLEFRVKLRSEFEAMARSRPVWLRPVCPRPIRLAAEPRAGDHQPAVPRAVFSRSRPSSSGGSDRPAEDRAEQTGRRNTRPTSASIPSGKWERRITDRWEVFFPQQRAPARERVRDGKDPGPQPRHPPGLFTSSRRGLPQRAVQRVPRGEPHLPDFLLSESGLGRRELRQLRDTFVANLISLRSLPAAAWRDVRFRGGLPAPRRTTQSQRLRVEDRVSGLTSSRASLPIRTIIVAGRTRSTPSTC